MFLLAIFSLFSVAICMSRYPVIKKCNTSINFEMLLLENKKNYLNIIILRKIFLNCVSNLQKAIFIKLEIYRQVIFLNAGCYLCGLLQKLKRKKIILPPRKFF